jgi:hypothetical protein
LKFELDPKKDDSAKKILSGYTAIREYINELAVAQKKGQITNFASPSSSR